MALTARAQLEAWIEAQIDPDQDDVSLPDLARDAEAFLDAQPALKDDLLRDAVRQIVYAAGQRVVARSRGTLIRFGDAISNRTRIQRKAAVLQDRWANWLEHAGRKHIRLMRMEAGDLRQAAAERRARGDTELLYARLWDSLANDLATGQTVGDKFSGLEIEQRLQRLRDASQEETA